MPSLPPLSHAAASLPPSIFSRLYDRLARFSGDAISLQIGDTYRDPPLAARLGQQGFADADAAAAQARELYAYAAPAGWPPLINAIVEKVRRQNHLQISPAGVQVTCGATHGLSCAVATLLNPGDELLVLSPHWPLISGIAQARQVVPVEVDVSQALLAGELSGDEAIAARLASALSPRTKAIYLGTPNNPDGYVYDEAQLRQIAQFAQAHQLWILADEVYEHYVYRGQHVSIASLPEAAARTVTVFSFSKSYGMAGLRLGYVVGPDDVIAALRKISNYTVYNVPQALQRAALAAMRAGDEFLSQAREEYLAAAHAAAARLSVPSRLPHGSTYLFLDLRPWCAGQDGMQVLENFAEAGVMLAPGSAFGAAYAGFARLCFTAVDARRLAIGIDRINDVLSRQASR